MRRAIGRLMGSLVCFIAVANNADVNAKNKVNSTPFSNATIERHNDVADLLKQHGGHE